MMIKGRYKLFPGQEFRGGFGSARVAEDTFLGRRVIIKSVEGGQAKDQLVREVSALAKIRSRHVVEIYDLIYGDSGQVEAIVIEYLEGRGFENFHLEAMKDTLSYLLVLYQISLALKDLHDHGITHRDIKLENIKSSSSGVVKIFDFGISSSEPDYRTRLNRGTYAYAAPELYQPHVCISPVVDVYAFGVCAWALSTHSFPRPLLERPPQKIEISPSIDSVFSGRIEEEVVRIIDSCLCVDPSERPSSNDVLHVLSRSILRNQHRGIFVYNNISSYELNSENRDVNIRIGQLGDVKVIYNGACFRIASVKGDVYVNNTPASTGMLLPSACVLTFGAPDRRSAREWVTFTSSHPEVLI